jgi:hypothetical protein
VKVFSGTAILAAGLFAVQPAKAADGLSCMTAEYAQPEQTVLDRNAQARRGEDGLSRAVFNLIEARGRTCAYLNGWNENTQRLAVVYRWTTEQWFNRQITAAFTAEQQSRLRAALEPKKSKLMSSFTKSVEAVAHGWDSPAPVPDAGEFNEYEALLKAAGIPKDARTVQLLNGWLYTEGFTAALKLAFEAA